MLFVGMSVVAFHRPPAPPRLSVPDGTTAIFSGCVVDPALVGADRERFGVELAPGAKAEVSLYAKPDEHFPALPYGTVVEFEGKARAPHNYANPGSFDYKHFLARQTIYWSISAPASAVRALPGHCGDALSGMIFGFRGAALVRLDRLYAHDPYANGMMQAVLIGATAKLDRLWTVDYRSTGTFHALVISGSHVAVLAAVLLFFLRIVGAPRGFAVFATILVAWLYAGITGWQAPVLRSAAGMTLYGIGRCFYREGRILNILAAVAILFVIVDPEEIFDASFQLSFLAVAAIGAFVVPALEATSGPLALGLNGLADTRRDLRLPAKTAQFRVELRLLVNTIVVMVGHRWCRLASFVVVAAGRFCLYLWEIFVTSFFIQIALALPTVVYFHRLPVSGLTANAIIVPALSALVPLGFLAIATQSHSLAAVCARLLDISRSAAGFHARWEPDWRIPAPPLWLAIVFVLLLIIAASRRRWLWPWAAASLALSAVALHPFAPQVQAHALELSMIDVGQGDSLLAAFPDGKLMLIDAGGIPSFGRARKSGIDIGEDVVSPYLWTRSIKRLDVVVMTHAHTDHMGGMPAVLKNFRPRELWVGAVGESPEWKEVRAAAQSLGIRVKMLHQSEPFRWGGADLQVLAPFADYEATDRAANNDSLVMRVQYGSNGFLLTGDMEKQIEERLFDAGLLHATDVLKVGHHGSRTSTTTDLLSAVKPAFGLISVGFENSYGHPHPLTVVALNEHHVAIYRTDERGLIRIISDGRRIEVESQKLPGPSF